MIHARWRLRLHEYLGGTVNGLGGHAQTVGGTADHVHLLVESGIHLIEVLNLEELARAQVYEFLFVAAPLNIRGATGAPIRPLAFANR